MGEADLPGGGVVGHLCSPVQRDDDMVTPTRKEGDISEDIFLDQSVDRETMG